MYKKIQCKTSVSHCSPLRLLYLTNVSKLTLEVFVSLIILQNISLSSIKYYVVVVFVWYSSSSGRLLYSHQHHS